MAKGAIGFATTEAMPYASMLITQFGGDEFDSGSCLGFAPKHRTGSNGKVTKRDWQVPSPDSADFVKLEPWAVPCSNQWAKDHPEKWEGYSFYTYESVIEKCVAISYSMSVQPTLAFVGGLEFELMPAPLAEVTTEVCWPDRVSAPDLSLIVTTIRTGGIVLFKHTIRLHKRFGSDTGFTAGNIKDAVERARNYFGKGTNDDDDKSLQGMPRSVLSQVENSTESTSETETDEETHFHPEQEEIFLASAKYDAQLGVNLTHRFSGHEAHARVRAAMRPRKLGVLQQDEVEQGLGRHELFELSSPSKSLVGFSVIGELESGVMQLKLQMKFGPIPSPEKTIPLLNLADHLRITLAAIPFISQASKQKAVDAFSSTDLSLRFTLLTFFFYLAVASVRVGLVSQPECLFILVVASVLAGLESHPERFPLLGAVRKAQYAMSGTVPAAQPGGGAASSVGQDVQERIDAIVKQRLEQAFGSVFGKVLTATERAAVAAEKQADASKVEGITKALRVDVWKPANREEELRGWREWMFQLRTWLAAHDERFENDIEGLDDDKEVDHALIDDDQVRRSQKLFGVLCSLLRNRPLLLVRGFEKDRNGLEALRTLRKEMEPKERSRSLAIVKQLATWTFKDGGLHEQLIAFEDAIKNYEASSGNTYPEDLMIATVTTGLKEPLRSQVQLRMSSSTKYRDIREWVLQWESVNAPWSSSLPAARGSKPDSGGPQPMDVDVIKGKKGKDKGKKGKGKGKDGKPSGKGKQDWNQNAGWQSNAWHGGWQNNAWNNGGWNQDKGGGKNQPKGKGKSKGQGHGKQGSCHICGQTGHWKNECPKGKGKTVRQVEVEAVPSSGQSVASATTAATSATAYRTPSVVQRIALSTPPQCRETFIFDMAEEFEEFELEGGAINMIQIAGVAVEIAAHEFPEVPHFAMDATDDDEEWTVCPELCYDEPEREHVAVINMVRATATAQHTSKAVDVVVDSGADVSVAPLEFRSLGRSSPNSNVLMQDAQGKQIVNHGSRALVVEVKDINGETAVIKERFLLAEVSSLIISMGRLLRNGWCLGHVNSGPVISRDGCVLPVRLRRNTLVMSAIVSAIAVLDSGPLPPPAEDVCGVPGWHVLPSGLPFLVHHHTLEVPFESWLWSTEDWTHVAVFVRKEAATRGPQPGDVWIQVLSTTTEAFENMPKRLDALEAELTGYHDVAVLLHVVEMEKNLLSNPSDYFEEEAWEDAPMLPNEPQDAEEDEADDGRGVGDVLAEGRAPRGQEADDDGLELDGVQLSVGTPLRELKALCQRLGLAKSGGKAKVLRRLKEHRDVMERQMATQIAQQLFREGDRDPQPFKVPVLPSRRQQELHEITHQPFQPWCQACLMGRSRQSPHRDQEPAESDAGPRDARPLMQIDYCFTFTDSKQMIQDEQAGEIDEPVAGDSAEEKDEAEKAEKPNYMDQFGLNLVAAESSSGWVAALPLLAKGAVSLKKTTETLTRLSMQLAGTNEIILQGDPEPSVRQVLNSVQACRTKLGLKTTVREAPRGSHSSNGLAEKGVSTIRRFGLTLKAHLEERIQAKLGGHVPLFSWLLQHASFLHNRYFVGHKGLPAWEVVHGRRFSQRLLPFGEVCLFYLGSKFKGDLQWQKGVFAGVNERRGTYVLLTPDGAKESRSLRRLPREDAYPADFILTAKGLPWDAQGKTKRQRPLYTARPGLLPDSATLEELAKAAGIREIQRTHGDIPLEELTGCDDWLDDVVPVLDQEPEEDDWEDDRPPDVSPDELAKLDLAADKAEVERLVAMGVMRPPSENDDLANYSVLTTKVVRDWRRRPNWVRRSRLVGREFKAWTPWSQDLFAPASTLATVHGLMSLAQAYDLELVTLDVKDAYLNVKQKKPVIIYVDARLFDEGQGEERMIPYILEYLLPGQRAAASEWFQYFTGLLGQAGMESFGKEPTLFRNKEAQAPLSGLVLHADDGLLASKKEFREKLVGELSQHVTVQVSEPLKSIGSELSFLKRSYSMHEDGIHMHSGRRHVEGLLEALEPGVKLKDAPTDASFLEVDNSPELKADRAKVFRECIGRLLYLSHSRADIQFGVCILASKMAKPTMVGWKQLYRLVGYLKKVPCLGFRIGPATEGACLDFPEGSPTSGKIILESVSDADWAGCRQTRRSRSSVHFYLAGSLIGSYVRSQRTVAMSSGESEFLAMISGACETVYLKDCFEYLLRGITELEAVLRSDSAAARGVSQRVGCGRVRHLSCANLWVQAAVKSQVLKIGPISGKRNPSDLGTKPLTGPKLRELLFRAGAVTESGDRYGAEEADLADQRDNVNRIMKSGGLSSTGAKKFLPVLLILAQAMTAEGYEGLSLVAAAGFAEDTMAQMISAVAILVATVLVVCGGPWAAFCGLKWLLGWSSTGKQAATTTCEVGVQANLGMSKAEQKFVDEYVDRATFLRSSLSEEHRTVLQCEEALVEVREENRRLQAELTRARAQGAGRIALSTNRGRVYHDLDAQFQRLFDVLCTGSTMNRHDFEHFSRGIQGHLHILTDKKTKIALLSPTQEDLQWIAANFEKAFPEERPLTRQNFPDVAKLVLLRRVVRTLIEFVGIDHIQGGMAAPLVVDIAVNMGSTKGPPFRIHTVAPSSRPTLESGERLNAISE
ncbi:unnamed protein product [Symbiodinium sp. CCMP2592]|nr:unnamed protein product [Symbiodinium sp. CCMP2592]